MTLALLALRCPDCPPAREARELFFGLDLLRNLLIASAPFAVTLGLVLLIVRSISSSSRRAKGSTDASETRES